MNKAVSYSLSSAWARREHEECGCDWLLELCISLFLSLRNFFQALIMPFQWKEKILLLFESLREKKLFL